MTYLHGSDMISPERNFVLNLMNYACNTSNIKHLVLNKKATRTLFNIESNVYAK